MAIDAQVEINQPRAVEDEPENSPPTSEESRDKAAADAALSVMISAVHSPSEVASLHLT